MGGNCTQYQDFGGKSTEISDHECFQFFEWNVRVYFILKGFKEGLHVMPVQGETCVISEVSL